MQALPCWLLQPLSKQVSTIINKMVFEMGCCSLHKSYEGLP